ncbi:hypothetical protein [Streptomyces sp. NPDC002851]
MVVERVIVKTCGSVGAFDETAVFAAGSRADVRQETGVHDHYAWRTHVG